MPSCHARCESLIVVSLVAACVLIIGACASESPAPVPPVGEDATLVPPTIEPTDEPPTVVPEAPTAAMSLIPDEQMEKIKAALKVEEPEIVTDVSEVPMTVFANGAKMTISPYLSWGDAEFISDPSDPLTVKGTADSTAYVSGTGAVVTEGTTVYLFGWSWPEGGE